MNTDKIIIITASVLVLFLLLFKGKIVEEYQLLTELDVNDLSDDLVLSFFQPLSKTHREEQLREYLAAFEAIQKKVNQSYLVKYFVNYSEYISKYQLALQNKPGEDEDWKLVSFAPSIYNEIIATGEEFDEEMLFALRSLLNGLLNEKEVDLSILRIEMVNSNPVMWLYLDENVGDVDFQTFVNVVSVKLFKGEAITLHVEKDRTSTFHANNTMIRESVS